MENTHKPDLWHVHKTRSLACEQRDDVYQEPELRCSSNSMGSSLCPHRSASSATDGEHSRLSCRARMASTAERDERTAGDQPGGLQEPGSCRASDQVRSWDEVADARGTHSGRVSSSFRCLDQPVQPICKMDSVSEMSGQSVVPVPASGEELSPELGPERCNDTTDRAHVPHSEGTTCGTWQNSRDTDGLESHGGDSPGPGGCDVELPESRGTDEHGDATGRPVPGGAGAWAGSDAEHDAAKPDTGSEARCHSDTVPARELSPGCTRGGSMVGCGVGRVQSGLNVQSERDDAQLRQQQPRPWPTWMVRTGTIATAALLTWHQCSPDFQDQLHGLGFEREECYIFKYDLGVDHPVCPDYKVVPGANDQRHSTECPGLEVCPDYEVVPGADDRRHSQVCSGDKVCPGDAVHPGATECVRQLMSTGETQFVDPTSRPTWVPPFAQHRHQRLTNCTSLESEALGDPNWCTIWRRVVTEMGDIIEDSPGPHAALDFATPLDLRVSCWGLPLDFVRLANFSTQEVLPLRLDSEGQVSEEGTYCAVHSDLLSEEVIGFWTEASHDVSSKGEIHRCAQNLCFLAKNTTNGGNRRLDFAELFSPPRVSPLAQQMGLKVDASAVFDLTAGWDVRNKEHRRRFRTFQSERRPKTLMASPECKAFSPLQNINKERLDPEYLRKILTEGQLMWDYSLEAVNTQTVNDDYFGLEHPERASSWKLPQTQRLLRRPDVAVIIFDQCALGLTVVPDGMLSRKTTRIATNNPWLAKRLLQAQCVGGHPHRQLIGGLPALAQEYPPALCQCIAESARDAALGLSPPSFVTEPTVSDEPSWNFPTLAESLLLLLKEKKEKKRMSQRWLNQSPVEPSRL